MAVNLINTIKPTDEQREAITYFAEGEDLVIQAGAGTGKTSTLKMLGKYNKGRGQYIAFNKAIVEEAKQKFPEHIKANTAHSIAFGRTEFSKDRLFNGKRVRAIDVANFLGIKPIILSVGDSKKVLSASYLGSFMNRTIDRFCQSEDHQLEPWHFPYIDGIDLPLEGGKRSYVNNNLVRERLWPHFDKAWADITSYDGFMRFNHQHYLKMFQLGEARINCDFILFDEAQDANPVILDIVLRQKAQKVFVGDTQQQIYGFTGAINAMERLDTENVTYLTQSFRFGDEVATVANKVLEKLGAELRLKGLVSIDSRVLLEPEADCDVILTRTNAAAIEYALGAQSVGKTVAIVGGSKDLVTFAKAAQDLQNRRSTIHPELCCFQDWAEVQEYVKYDEDGADLKLMVSLIDRYGAQKVIDALSITIDREDLADVVVSTAHKSKGREWDRVKLGNDFPDEGGDKPIGAEELRLLYVAVTRAKLQLDIGSLPYLH